MATPGNLGHGIRVVTFNLHGFKSSWDYLRKLTCSYDVIFVQELWLLPSELYLLQSVSDDFVVFAKSSIWKTS